MIPENEADAMIDRSTLIELQSYPEYSCHLTEGRVKGRAKGNVKQRQVLVSRHRAAGAKQSGGNYRPRLGKVARASGGG